MHNLALHISNTLSKSVVKVDFKLKDQLLVIDFEVFASDLVTSDEFCTKSFENWGLWETDVVEVFLTKSVEKLPYLELQLSPLQQKFALIVESPREKYQYPEVINTKFQSEVDKKSWKATFKVPVSEIPGEGNEIFGNFHACLGNKKNRSYYGLNINPEVKVDFHRPDLFIKLGEV